MNPFDTAVQRGRCVGSAETAAMKMMSVVDAVTDALDLRTLSGCVGVGVRQSLIDPFVLFHHQLSVTWLIPAWFPNF